MIRNLLYNGFGKKIQSIVFRSCSLDHRMVRDIKRRKLSAEFYNLRMRLNALRKNDLLPDTLKEVAHKEVSELPRDSNFVRIRSRCVLTSRPRGLYKRYKMSRFCFRHLADHNLISGMTRAMW
ncbi:unnamed protein product [Gordionus sp. m RMFG-2023]